MKKIKSLFAILIAAIMLMTSTTAFASSINSIATAAPITLGSTVYAQFSSGVVRTGPKEYDVDFVDNTFMYFSFAPQVSDYYEITITGHENIKYDNGYVSTVGAYVKDSSGEFCGSVVNNEYNNIAKGAVYLKAGQTYYIELDDTGLGSCSVVQSSFRAGYIEETLALTVVRHEHNFKVTKYSYSDGSYSTYYECNYCNYETDIYTPAKGSGESAFQYVSSATGSSFTSVKKTSISKLTAKKKGFTVKWKKPSNASGYQVQYATNKKMTKDKKTVTINKSGTTTYTQNKLKAKKTYYVRVRAYAVVNGKKVYSDWTSPKSVKTK